MNNGGRVIVLTKLYSPTAPASRLLSTHPVTQSLGLISMIDNQSAVHYRFLLSPPILFHDYLVVVCLPPPPPAPGEFRSDILPSLL